jgi:hypothetical protein
MKFEAMEREKLWVTIVGKDDIQDYETTARQQQTQGPKYHVMSLFGSKVCYLLRRTLDFLSASNQHLLRCSAGNPRNLECAI